MTTALEHEAPSQMDITRADLNFKERVGDSFRDKKFEELLGLTPFEIDLRDHRESWLNPKQKALGLAISTLLAISCFTASVGDNPNLNPQKQEEKQPPTPTLGAGGSGGAEPLPTVPAGFPDADKYNATIAKINKGEKVDDNQAVNDAQKALEASGVVRPAGTSTPESTAEAQKPNTPEKKPLFSKLFPGVDVSNAEIIPYTDSTGSIDLVVIDLLPNVTLAAPMTSTRFATAEAGTPFYGSWASFSPAAGGAGITVIGSYKLLIEAPAGVKIEEGQPFGVTGETDHKNPGGKTIIIQIAKRDPNTKKWFTPTEEVEKYFPGIYTKAAAKAINYDGPIKGVTTYHYSGGPNDSP